MERWRDGEMERWRDGEVDAYQLWLSWQLGSLFFVSSTKCESRVPGAWHPPFTEVLNTSHEYTYK